MTMTPHGTHDTQRSRSDPSARELLERAYFERLEEAQAYCLERIAALSPFPVSYTPKEPAWRALQPHRLQNGLGATIRYSRRRMAYDAYIWRSRWWTQKLAGDT